MTGRKKMNAGIISNETAQSIVENERKMFYLPENQKCNLEMQIARTGR